MRFTTFLIKSDVVFFLYVKVDEGGREREGGKERPVIMCYHLRTKVNNERRM